MKYLNCPERVAIPGKEYEKLWQKYQTEGIALSCGLSTFWRLTTEDWRLKNMTNDELRSFILDRLAPSLEQAWRERDTLAERAESSRQEAEREREARKKAEKEAADKEKENAALRKAFEDERNRNKTHVRNKFGSR